MQWPRAVTDQLEQLVALQPLDSHADEGRFNAISGILASLDNDLREQIQAATAAPVAQLIDTLRSDGSVGPADLDLIRLWVVGDADYYVKAENDFPAWMTEMERLLGALRSLVAEAVTPAAMARMEATVRDALRVASDIAFYRQQ
ncbi:MAG: hypothetical protein M3Q93_06675 [Gemmatimonadota bacterium]|nr:hypothetical protein [Gemmatimonadota bacterium]